MKFATADAATYTVIDLFDTIEDAHDALLCYEEEDEKDGVYSEDFYEIVFVDDDGKNPRSMDTLYEVTHCSVKSCDEQVILFTDDLDEATSAFLLHDHDKNHYVEIRVYDDPADIIESDYSYDLYLSDRIGETNAAVLCRKIAHGIASKDDMFKCYDLLYMSCWNGERLDVSIDGEPTGTRELKPIYRFEEEEMTFVEGDESSDDDNIYYDHFVDCNGNFVSLDDGNEIVDFEII